MGIGRKLALLVGAAVVATAASAQPAGQKVTGPVAVYWMSAATQTGFGLPGMGGGAPARPSMSQIMNMVRGGGGPQHSLILQLGSTTMPQGEPRAEHAPPNGLGVGPSLPLVSPEPPKPVVVHDEPPEKPEVPREYQRPKGRMLIFWGCGEHAKPGQPLVIDFAQMTPEKLAAGQMPANLMAAMRGFDIRRMQPPSPARYTTYGDWPNAQARTAVPGEGSLVGDHRVSGDYSPEIKFALSADQDFLGPLNLTSNAKLPSGAVQLGWNTVPGAEAYVASFIGGGGQDTVVMWSSSEVQTSAFAMPDYLSPGDIARLVGSQALMGPGATSCAVPQEAVAAGAQGLLQMVAYGKEANFVYPPRPKDPKVAWNRQWEVKVRYRSATGGLLGQAMPGIGGGGRGGRGGPAGGQDGAPTQAGQQQPPPDPAAARRRAILNGLGGLIPH